MSEDTRVAGNKPVTGNDMRHPLPDTRNSPHATASMSSSPATTHPLPATSGEAGSPVTASVSSPPDTRYSLPVTQPQRLDHPVRLPAHSWPEGTVPVVSVFCITYNHEKFIREAIEGFLMQETTFPVEIFVHDDASTDGTADIIREYESKHPQLFRTILQTENQYSKYGFEPVLRMLKSQRGEFIAICEGDDYWTASQKLQMQVDTLEKEPRCSMCFHNAIQFDQLSGKRSIFNERFNNTELNFKDMLKHSFIIPTASMVFQRFRIATLPMIQTPFFGDSKIQFTLADQGPFYFINKDWSVYRSHEGGMMRRIGQEWFTVGLPNLLKFLCEFNTLTDHRNEKLLWSHLVKHSSGLTKYLIQKMREEQNEYLSGIGPLPQQMESCQACDDLIRKSLNSMAGGMTGGFRGRFLLSRLYKATIMEALISAGDAWYLKQYQHRAARYYLRAFQRGGIFGIRGALYYLMSKMGYAGRAFRSACHHAEMRLKDRTK